MTDFAWPDAPEPAAVRGLLDAVAAVDGRPSLSSDGTLPREFRGGAVLLATEGAAAVGLAHLAAGSGRAVAELLVRPDARGRGIGAELAARLLDRVGPGGDLRVWAHGDQPAAARLAQRFGFRRVRELRRLVLDLGELPEVALPAGVRLRAFVVGADEEAVLAVNRRAFAWHPEQGALSLADLTAAEAESWFDPAGFLLAEDAAGAVVGFHWTKVHGGAEPIGEVYVVGVDPDAQGGGLGRALTLAGLHHLARRGDLRRVMLYVESDNPAALAVYARLGFTLWDADVQYAR